jgi:hypothetical protein
MCAQGDGGPLSAGVGAGNDSMAATSGGWEGGGCGGLTQRRVWSGGGNSGALLRVCRVRR